MVKISQEEINYILDSFKDCSFTELTYNNFIELIVQELYEDFYEEYFNGATKLVFTLPNKDYVIKIPFCGDYGYEEVVIGSYIGDDGERYEEYDDERVFREFSGARSVFGESCDWDYCKTEELTYQKAKQYRVEEYFAETICIGKVHGHPIYVQEKVEIFDEVGPKTAVSVKEKAYLTVDEELGGYYPDRLPVAWIVDLFKITEKMRSKRNSFFRFLKENRIYDLHSENVGYTYDGIPVLLDYSSFNE